MKRKVNVIEDLDGKKTVFIHDILFKGKRAVKWDEVEKYLRQYVGDICTIDDSNEVIYIGADLPDEYAHSNYTHFWYTEIRSRSRRRSHSARYSVDKFRWDW